jgi:hypothetical protein
MWQPNIKMLPANEEILGGCSITLSLFFAVLGIELRTSHLLGKHSTT